VHTARLFLLSEVRTGVKQGERHQTTPQVKATVPQSTDDRLLDFVKGHVAVSASEAALHIPQTIEDFKQKRCALCRHQNVTTKRGWVVLTQFRCSKCYVPLCVGQRNCFKIYHRLLLAGEIEELPTGRVSRIGQGKYC
jgi:hypothetical protein